MYLSHTCSLIFALGVCLYAMLCGKLPFRDDDVDILRLAMQDRLHFHRHVSKGTSIKGTQTHQRKIHFILIMMNNRYIPLIGFVINGFYSFVLPHTCVCMKPQKIPTTCYCKHNTHFLDPLKNLN